MRFGAVFAAAPAIWRVIGHFLAAAPAWRRRVDVHAVVELFAQLLIEWRTHKRRALLLVSAAAFAAKALGRRVVDAQACVALGGFVRRALIAAVALAQRWAFLEEFAVRVLGRKTFVQRAAGARSHRRTTCVRRCRDRVILGGGCIIASVGRGIAGRASRAELRGGAILRARSPREDGPNRDTAPDLPKPMPHRRQPQAAQVAAVRAYTAVAPTFKAAAQLVGRSRNLAP